MSAELILNNARIVLADEIVEGGSLSIRDGLIADISRGRRVPARTWAATS